MNANGASPSANSADSCTLYLAQIQQYTPQSRQLERETARAARAGDEEALERLVQANLRFVVSVALQYKGRGVPLLDLISEGNTGLVEAARRFDERRGCKFITYAVWWIRERIHQALRRGSRSVPLTWKQVAERKKVKTERRNLMRTLDREVSFSEAVGAAGLDGDELTAALDDVSLDAPMVDGWETTWYDILSVPGGEAEKSLERRALSETVRDCLSDLDVREAEVIRSYFGLDDSLPKSLAEIGAGMGLSRERARQLRNSGLEKMRRRHGGVLQDFDDG